MQKRKTKNNIDLLKKEIDDIKGKNRNY